jgi:inorganic triphosphatase YgiF
MVAPRDIDDEPGEAREVELKLRVRPEDLPRLQRAAWLRQIQAGRPLVRHLDAVYFDTPDLDLKRKGAILRIRKEGRRFIQCVKAAAEPAGGALVRREWETAVAGRQPEPEAIADPAAQALIGNGSARRLKPVFETRIRRTTRRLVPARGEEIAFEIDVGEVAAGRRRKPVCEVELELKAGPPRCLYDLARRMLDTAPIRVVADTKSDVGYRLLERQPAGWRKAVPVVLPAEASAEDALAAVVSHCLDHLLGNESCVLEGGHPEGVHQMRVAVRRLRSALAVYRRLLPADQVARLADELKWLAGELGPARDWDVFLAELLGPVVRGLPADGDLGLLKAAAESRRVAGYAQARAAVESQRFTALVLALGAWLHGREWQHGAPGDESAHLNESAAALAAARLAKRHARLLKRGRHFRSLDAEARHRLRIEIKKQRYATDFFGSLFPRKKVRRYAETMAELQDLLGLDNDVAVARRLLDALADGCDGAEALRFRYAAGTVLGWHACLFDERQRDLARVWKRFVGTETYWPAPAVEEPAAEAPAEATP